MQGIVGSSAKRGWVAAARCVATSAGRSAWGARARALWAPGLAMPGGTNEALKWLALLLMTLDHVNKYLVAGGWPWLSVAGRLAMPLFGFVLAYNLARPGARAAGVHGRVMRRLAMAGLAAAIPLCLLGMLERGWWPLNVMFMLLVATALTWLIERGSQSALLLAGMLFVFGGLMVDYVWFGLLYCLCAWWFCKQPGALPLVAWGASAVGLYPVNGNAWAVAALPLILAAWRMSLPVPRTRLFFYAYYPAHLFLLLLIGPGPALGR